MTAKHRPIRVFISGPLESHGQVAANVGAAIKVATGLRLAGFDFYLPHLNWFVQAAADKPFPRESWLSHDLNWLALCDVMVRIPGLSPGADVEESRAHELRIPVVHLGPGRPVAEQIAEVLR